MRLLTWPKIIEYSMGNTTYTILLFLSGRQKSKVTQIKLRLSCLYVNCFYLVPIKFIKFVRRSEIRFFRKKQIPKKDANGSTV